MSIDTRLRTGLREESDTLDVHTDGWADVVSRAHAARTRSLTLRVAALAAAAAAVVVLVVVTRPDAGDEPEPAPPPPSPTEASPAPAAVEGSWEAGPVRVPELREHLEAEGLGRHVDTVVEGATVADADAIAFRVWIAGGRLTTTVSIDGAPWDVHDQQGYEVDGNDIAFTPNGASCATTFRWSVADDRLSLRLRGSDCPAALGGAPEAAYQAFYYTAIPFTRVG